MTMNAVEEAVAHSSQSVPYTYYSNCIPGGKPGVIVHWHKEFEINYVQKGRMQFLYGEQRIYAAAGDLVIVCPNALHGVFPDGEEDYEYDTLVFSSRLVGSSVNDRCAAEYIRPLMNGSKTLHPHISKTSACYERNHGPLGNKLHGNAAGDDQDGFRAQHFGTIELTGDHIVRTIPFGSIIRGERVRPAQTAGKTGNGDAQFFGVGLDAQQFFIGGGHGDLTLGTQSQLDAFKARVLGKLHGLPVGFAYKGPDIDGFFHTHSFLSCLQWGILPV